MKSNSISIALTLILSAGFSGLCAADALSLEEAIKGGSASGDVTNYYEKRSVKKGTPSTYYNNTAYDVGSIGLNYKTAAFHNVSVAVGFRAAQSLWESDKNFTTAHGKGDSTERIYEGDEVLLGNAYLEYNDGETIVRAGRQEMITDWVGKYNDGIRITNNSIKNLQFDLIWLQNQGRVYSKEMWGFKSRNKEKGGYYNAGVTFDTGVGLKAKVYGMYAKDVFSGEGIKLTYDRQIEDLNFGLMAHYATSNEEKEKRGKGEDGKIFEGSAYVKAYDIKTTIGYVKTGKESGWGSLNFAGDQVVPFEEGDAMYERNAETYYLMMGTSLNKLNLTALYGSTKFDAGADSKRVTQDELSIWASYPITKALAALVIYDRTFKGHESIPTIEQIGLGLSYKF
ncbi:Opr family porin [Wolinella succinogenes]|uniref:Opr family porin n=1 Tax=Wolinella succinogenes TaxID=844 RepID=UPI002FC8232B